MAPRCRRRSVAESEIDARWESWTEDATVAVAAQLDQTDTAWRLYTFLPMQNSPSPFAARAGSAVHGLRSDSSVTGPRLPAGPAPNISFTASQ